MESKIRRNRPIKSCYFCYTRKLKCNREQPRCQQCVITNNRRCFYGFNKHSVENLFKPSASDIGGEKYLPGGFYPYFDDASNVNYMIESSRTQGSKFRYSYDFSDVSFATKLTLSQVFKYLPGKRQCQRWINTYFSNIHPIVPILDPVTVKNKVNELFSQEINENTDLSTLILTFAMLFSVVISLEIESEFTKESNDKVTSGLKNKYFEAVEYLKLVLRFPSDPSLSCIQASLIVYTASVNFKDVSVQVSGIVKAAEMLGLHRDPCHISKEVDHEIRKTLWCYVMLADISSSIYHGLSSSSARMDFDSPPPLYLLQDRLDISLAFLVARQDCSVLLSKIIDILNGTKPVHQELISQLHLEVLEIFNKTQIILDALSNELGSVRYSEWLKSNIRIFVFRCYLMWERMSSKINIGKLKTRLETAQQLLTYDKLHSLLESTSVDNVTIKIAILLLYNTQERITIGEHNIKFLWFICQCEPFQYLLIVLRDLYYNPTDVPSFDDNSLPAEISAYVPVDIKSNGLDQRIVCCNNVFQKLEVLSCFWSESVKGRYRLLKNLKDYIFQRFDDHVENEEIEFDKAFDSLLKLNDEFIYWNNLNLDSDINFSWEGWNNFVS